jgi:hypothetical protein
MEEKGVKKRGLSHTPAIRDKRDGEKRKSGKERGKCSLFLGFAQKKERKIGMVMHVHFCAPKMR